MWRRDPAPFRDSLSSAGWDLIWSTCPPNLKYLRLPTTKIWKTMQKVEIGVVLGITGHLRSSATKPFDWAHIISYLTLYRFWPVIYRKLPILTHPTCNWRPWLGDTIRISPRSLASENWGSWAIVWRCLRHSTFSRFETIPACDRQTDWQTWRLHITR